MDGGKRAITIDEVPLEWCFQPGVKLDFRHFPTAMSRPPRTSRPSSKRIGHTLSPLEIVRGQHQRRRTPTASPDYVAKGCGMGREATLYLLERGVRVTGTDGWSWDAPFVLHREEILAETKTPA